jgi:RNA polymerase sigma-70 factor (ECF subfamily)
LDPQAVFLELLKENHGRWRAIARSYAGQDAEDLFQQILLQIWRSLRTFEGKCTGGTWCYRVALNTAMSWRRSERTRRQRLPVRAGFNPLLVPSPACPRESPELLQTVLAALSPADRAILLLFLDDLSYSEMAQILGATEGSLRVRIHRIKQHVAELTQGQRDEP